MQESPRKNHHRLMTQGTLFLLVLTFALASGCAGRAARSPYQTTTTTPFDLKNFGFVQDRAGQDPDLSVVVAISGGGFRSANLALGAMLAMEQIEIETSIGRTNLLAEVDYITTVSGGGFAAGTFIRGMLSLPPAERHRFSLAEHLQLHDKTSSVDPPGPLSDGLLATRAPETTAPLRRTLFWRLLGYALRPSTILSNQDRGDLLQLHLDRTILGLDSCQGGFASTTACQTNRERRGAPENGHIGSLVLGDVFVAEGRKPSTPYWITNATNFSNGGIFSFTPDSFCKHDVKQVWHREHIDICGEQNSNAFEVPLALGMRTSANFPVGIPATTLCVASSAQACGRQSEGTKFIKLSDGGQSDNLAFYSALEILHQDKIIRASRDARGTADTKPYRRLLVVIDAFNSSLHNVEPEAGAPSWLRTLRRAPTLPLDALRHRVRTSSTETSFTSRSELEGLAGNDNLAVAYINIDHEHAARQIGTTLWLNQDEQELLIDTGYRQAMAVLSAQCEVKRRSNPGTDDVCLRGNVGGDISIVAPRGIVEFNLSAGLQRRNHLLDYRQRLLGKLIDHIVKQREWFVETTNRNLSQRHLDNQGDLLRTLLQEEHERSLSEARARARSSVQQAAASLAKIGTTDLLQFAHADGECWFDALNRLPHYFAANPNENPSIEMCGFSEPLNSPRPLYAAVSFAQNLLSACTARLNAMASDDAAADRTEDIATKTSGRESRPADHDAQRRSLEATCDHLRLAVSDLIVAQQNFTNQIAKFRPTQIINRISAAETFDFQTCRHLRDGKRIEDLALAAIARSPSDRSRNAYREEMEAYDMDKHLLSELSLADLTLDTSGECAARISMLSPADSAEHQRHQANTIGVVAITKCFLRAAPGLWDFDDNRFMTNVSAVVSGPSECRFCTSLNVAHLSTNGSSGGMWCPSSASIE